MHQVQDFAWKQRSVFTNKANIVFVFVEMPASDLLICFIRLLCHSYSRKVIIMNAIVSSYREATQWYG